MYVYLISFPLTAQTGTLPEKIGCCIFALPADPSVGFLGPLGMDGILGGAVTTGTGAGVGAAAGSADSDAVVVMNEEINLWVGFIT